MSPATLGSLAVDVQTAEVVMAFHTEGIPCLLLKGPSIARWLYVDGTPRPYGDSDLLIPHEDAAAADRVLQQLGFQSLTEGRRTWELGSHETKYVRMTASGLGAVDLHTSFATLTVRPAAVWQALARHRVPMTLAGTIVQTPDVPARCLLLALHAVSHGTEEPKPLEDLRRGLRQESAAVWEAASELSDELGCRSAYELGLVLVDEAPGRLEDRPEWARADPAVRLQASSATVRGSGTLVHLLELSAPQRVLYALQRMFPSRALLAAVHDADRAPYAVLLGRHTLRSFRLLPAAWRQAREARRASRPA